MTWTSDFIHTQHKRFLRTGRRGRPANRAYEVVANKLIKNLLTNFSTVENEIPKVVVIRYLKRNPTIHLAFTGTMATEICEVLNWMGEQATSAIVWQLKTKLTDPGFTKLDEVIINSMPSNQKSLLSRPVKTKKRPCAKVAGLSTWQL